MKGRAEGVTTGMTKLIPRLVSMLPLLSAKSAQVRATIETGVVIMSYTDAWQPMAKYSYNEGSGGTLHGTMTGLPSPKGAKDHKAGPGVYFYCEEELPRMEQVRSSLLSKDEQCAELTKPVSPDDGEGVYRSMSFLDVDSQGKAEFSVGVPPLRQEAVCFLAVAYCKPAPPGTAEKTKEWGSGLGVQPSTGHVANCTLSRQQRQLNPYSVRRRT